MMKSTKEFWARKQFTDSASMEQFVLNKQSNTNLSNIRDEIENSSFAGKTLIPSDDFFCRYLLKSEATFKFVFA